MDSNVALEILLIDRFFQKQKVERYKTFVAKANTRRKFITALAHLQDLDYSKFLKVEHDPEGHLLEIAKKYSLNVCYVISENRTIDSQYIDIQMAVKSVIGYGMGTFLIFGQAMAIYYEGEDMNDRWISKS
jgi:hypothetical protein